MARQWVLTNQKGFETSLEYQENVRIPLANELNPKEVLVKLYAASLNYREIMISNPDTIVGPVDFPRIPGCDGAGLVVAVGSSVNEFRIGDRVVTHLFPVLDESNGDDSPATMADALGSLGAGCDGTLRSHGVFHQTTLVHAPASLQWKTSTSTDEKVLRLRLLGASHTVNYRTNPDNWGLEARNMTPGMRGFDIVADVGGNETLRQSMKAVKTDGTVVLVGGVGKIAEPVPMLEAIFHTCMVRGLLGGSRAQFRELVKYIDEKGIKPVIDDVLFELADAKDAYRRLNEKKHFAKVVMRIEHAGGL